MEADLTADTPTTEILPAPPRFVVRLPATRETVAFVQWMVRNGAPLFAPDEPGAENSTITLPMPAAMPSTPCSPPPATTFAASSHG